MKKARLLILMLVLILVLSGCDTYYATKYYPYFMSSHWVCLEPYFEITYEYKPSGYLKDVSCILVWNETTIPARIGFMAGSYEVYEYTDADSEIIPVTYFAGGWKYEQGNLVLSISDDFAFFNGEYTELVLEPQD